MANAAIYLDPEGYLTSGAVLMGRHSAGESFLRGFLRHANVDSFSFWNVAGRPQAELKALVSALHAPDKPVEWIDMRARDRLGRVGAAYLPHPHIGREAWQRRPFGDAAYSICGITHTTASAEIQASIGDLVLAPVQPHDALICTSQAVRAAVETQREAVRDYLAWQFGPRRTPDAQLATIPLGINTDDFAPSETDRHAWRARLGVPAEACVALYVGRFSSRGKMNPAPMALALERAARDTGQEIHWIMAGWGDDPELQANYHDALRDYCPSVRVHVVDGRPAGTRFSIWSAADLFISLSDNVQETFGLTPVEAMAAGLPSVVSDWDGYRDTVRDNVDGFRIRTIAPPPGAGRDLAHRYANGWIDYSAYVGAAAQLTAVDLDQAAQAIAVLVRHPRIRREMGEAARAHARAVFDWSAIIPRYQDLWSELAARRGAAPTQPQGAAGGEDNPWRMDPFRVFASYPTAHLGGASRLGLSPGMGVAGAIAILKTPLASFFTQTFPTPEEVERIVEFLAARQYATVAEVLEVMPPARCYFIERGLVWLAKFGILAILPPDT